MPKARVGGRGQGLASAGERKANDRNGATESVACLSEASLQREQRSEAGAALTSLLLSGSSQKVDFLSREKNKKNF